jgi:ABC-type transport system involved in cytochrome c biogenesis permease subunit
MPAVDGQHKTNTVALLEALYLLMLFLGVIIFSISYLFSSLFVHIMLSTVGVGWVLFVCCICVNECECVHLHLY